MAETSVPIWVYTETNVSMRGGRIHHICLGLQESFLEYLAARKLI